MNFSRLMITVCSCLVLLVNGNCGYSMEPINEQQNPFQIYRNSIIEVLKKVQINNLKYNIQQAFKEYNKYQWFKDLLTYIDNINYMLSDDWKMMYTGIYGTLEQYMKDIYFLKFVLCRNNIFLNNEQNALLKQLLVAVDNIFMAIIPSIPRQGKNNDFDIKGQYVSVMQYLNGSVHEHGLSENEALSISNENLNIINDDNYEEQENNEYENIYNEDENIDDDTNEKLKIERLRKK